MTIMQLTKGTLEEFKSYTSLKRVLGKYLDSKAQFTEPAYSFMLIASDRLL
jgi:hypothetical protein